MPVHVVEWLNLVVRWFHFITGVAWIGASFYFNWLENSLDRAGQRAEIAGSLWAVHGGGFYYVEKYKVAPREIPKTLHWFKYEAYFTWISGVTLLAIVYYLNPHLYLIDAARLPLTPAAAILASAGSLLGTWIVYDALCKSPLGRSNGKLAIVGFALATALAFGFSRLFSPRAAFIHVGAALGTCMVANVFRVIIPSQKALVAAAGRGEAPDATLGKKAFQRSLHNNYMTLPVLFIMISNHFPSVYTPALNWLLLAAIALVGALVRHWFNLKGRGQYNVWILPVAAAGMIALAFVTSPPHDDARLGAADAVTFASADAVVAARCRPCHAATPTDDMFTVAPAGVAFDTPEQMRTWAPRMKARAVTAQDMPFNNKTGMSAEERELLGRWIDQGAKAPP
jgi:uncharacterized membrane protein